MGIPWLLISASLVGIACILPIRSVQFAAVVLCTATLLRGVWFVAIYPFYVSPLRHLPIPPGKHWLWGHGLMLVREPTGAPASRWVNTIPNDGIIRYFWFFNSERILVTSPRSMAEVLVTKSYCFQKPATVRKVYSRLIGTGLVFAEGDEHKVQRRNLQPAFDFRQIKRLYPVFWEKGRELVKAVAAECVDGNAAEIEVNSWASRCTLDIIGLAGFGQDFGAINGKSGAFVQACHRLFDLSWRTQVLMLLGAIIPPWVTKRLPVKTNSDINQAVKLIRKQSLELIQSKAAAARLAKGEGQHKDILAVAMEGGQFSSEDLADQVMSFLAAGHGTSAGSMTWAAYMLAKNPDMQTRLRNEVRETISSLDADIVSSEIDGMPYLNAFCNEVLRYWCPVPVIARSAVENTTILEHPVRRGTHISISPWAMNRDPAQWGPDAAEFNPERWIAKLDDHGKPTGGGGASSNYSFATFSHGPRSCIGLTFAKAELACLLAGWVGMFEFELADRELMDEKRIKVARGLVAKPLGGVHLIVRALPGF